MATTQLPRWAPEHTVLHAVPAGELELLEQHVSRIAHHVGPRARVIQPGVPDERAARALLRGLDRPSAYVLVDMAHEPSHRIAHVLRGEHPDVDVAAVTADPVHAFDVPSPQHDVLTSLVWIPEVVAGALAPADAHAVFSMLGSMLGTIGGDHRLLLVGTSSAHRHIHAPEPLRGLLAAAGWRPRQVFTSPDATHRLWLCEPV